MRLDEMQVDGARANTVPSSVVQFGSHDINVFHNGMYSWYLESCRETNWIGERGGKNGTHYYRVYGLASNPRSPELSTCVLYMFLAYSVANRMTSLTIVVSSPT